MLGIVAILLPPLVFPAIRKSCGGGSDYPLVEWAVAVVAVNFAAIAVACYGFGNQEGICQLLNSNSVFWLKYVLLSSALAMSGALLSVWLQRSVSFSFGGMPKINWRIVRVCVSLIAVACILLHAVRIFNFDFWGDEAFSIKLARTSVPEMLEATASDVHPPLYYLILMAANRLLGDKGWVYNLVSVVPYVLTIILCFTCVRKRFGGSASIVLMACSTLMNSAITYNVEVRMYSWAALFSLVSYLWLLRVIERGRLSDWAVFCLASLAAGYTHYYALLLVAFLYCGLIVLSIARRVRWQRVFVACLLTVIGYAPWLAVLLGTLERTSESFWMTEVPALWESVRWLLDVGNGSGGTTTLLLFAFVLLLVLFILEKTGFVGVSKSNQKWVVSLPGKQTAIDDEGVWVLTGVASVLAVIVTGLLVSKMVRPVFALRYLYPAAMLVWLLLGVLSSRFGARRLISVVLVLLVLHAGLPAYKEQRSQEEAVQQVQAQTMEAMEEVGEGDVLLSDILHLRWSVLEAYFPGVRVGTVDMGAPLDAESGERTWLVLSSDLTEGQSKWIKSSGLEATEICHKGNLGRHEVHVYRLNLVDGGR